MRIELDAGVRVRERLPGPRINYDPARLFLKHALASSLRIFRDDWRYCAQRIVVAGVRFRVFRELHVEACGAQELGIGPARADRNPIDSLSYEMPDGCSRKEDIADKRHVAG